jgi:hypothetical protein
LIKLRKLKKKIEKTELKKNQLNQLEFLKKISIRFGFGLINLKPKKPNRTGSVKKNIIKTLYNF